MRRRNRSRYTVLACLSVQPMSGYDIRQFLAQTVAQFWSESYGQIYPTLKELEEEGMVSGRDDDASGRARRVYRLTDAGLAVLRSWLAEPPEPDVPRYEISLKMFFGDQLSLEDARAHLRAHRRRHAEQLAHFRAQEADLQERLEGEARLPYWLIVLRGGIRYAEMVVEWCDASLASLEGLEPEDYPAPPRAPVE